MSRKSYTTHKDMEKLGFSHDDYNILRYEPHRIKWKEVRHDNGVYKQYQAMVDGEPFDIIPEVTVK